MVNEQALAEGLEGSVTAGAAFDALERKPLPPDSPLRDPAFEEHVRLFRHFASGGRITRLSPKASKGMAGRCLRALIAVPGGNYGGDPAHMPYVVKKEAFQ